MVSKSFIPKFIVVILLLALLLTIGFMFSGKKISYQPSVRIMTDMSRKEAKTTETIQKIEDNVNETKNNIGDTVVAEDADKAAMDNTSPPASNSTLNLQLPKPEVGLVESDIVLPDSHHNMKNLLTTTKKEKQSGISVGGNVFLDEEKNPDPNAKAIDQLKGGEVSVKVNTK